MYILPAPNNEQSNVGNSLNSKYAYLKDTLVLFYNIVEKYKNESIKHK